jgi:integrase
VSRHSYATIAKYKGVPTAIISEALGHTSEEVTQIYLDSFDKEVLDKYHSMIIE